MKDFFKVVKYRFGLHPFGQSTLLGVDGWLVLSFVAYFIAEGAYVAVGKTTLPDWAASAQLSRETLLLSLVFVGLLININRSPSLARQQGFDITVNGWQYG